MKRLSLLFVVTIIMGLIFTMPAIAAKGGGGGSNPKHLIVVDKDGNGDFDTIQAAIDSITDASSTIPYRVTVNPGIYNEQVTMKSYVDIVGSGQENTVITSGGNSQTLLWDASSSSLENISVHGSPNAYDVLDLQNSASAVIRNVTVVLPDNRTGYGIYGDATPSTLRIYDSSILASATGSDSKGIDLAYAASVVVSGCNIDLVSNATGFSTGIEAANASIINTVVTLTNYTNGAGMILKDSEVLNSKVYVDTTAGTLTRGIVTDNVTILSSEITALKSASQSGTYAILNVNYSLVTINNSTITSSYRAIRGGGDKIINNSVLTGDISKTEGIFKIGSSQFSGTHNGTAGFDKIINCYDENFDPIPNL